MIKSLFFLTYLGVSGASAQNLTTPIEVLSGPTPNPSIDCPVVSLPDPLQIIRASLATQAASVCTNLNRAPLGVDEHRVSRRRDHELNAVGGDRFYTTGNFLIRRPEPNKYQFALNLNLRSSIDGMTDRMLIKIRQCLADMNPHMRGPNGETMEILALTPTEVAKLATDMQPAPINISVESANDERGNAESFGPNFQCSTINHELLHHLGLVDEYPEVDNAGVNNWNCRVRTVEPTIMNETVLAYAQCVPHNAVCECDERCQFIMSSNSRTKDIYLAMDSAEFLEVNFNKSYCGPVHDIGKEMIPAGERPRQAMIVTGDSATEGQRTITFVTRRATGLSAVARYEKSCVCPVQDSYCNRKVDEIKRRIAEAPRRSSCPHGVRTLHAGAVTDGETRLENGKLIINNPGNGRSIIEPKHFEKLIAADCPGQAPVYERCSQFANISQSSPQCQVPPECHDDGYYLRGILGSQPQ